MFQAQASRSPSDILRVDLVERAEAPSGEIAAPHQPIVRRRFGERGVSDRLERLQKIVASNPRIPLRQIKPTRLAVRA